MGLSSGDEGPRLSAVHGSKLVQESRPVAFDFAARILLGEPEIESVPGINIRKSAGSRAESMDQPRKPVKRFRPKNKRSSFVAALGWHQTILTIEPLRERDANRKAFLHV
jgi:hypothetical protein